MVSVDLGLVPKAEAENVGAELPAVADASGDGNGFDAFGSRMDLHGKRN